jgi:phosphatidylglycerophosphate synthase
VQRIRNFQSEDWYPALFIRPISIGMMLVVADWKLLTPNRLTALANLCKLAAAWFVFDGKTTREVVIAVVLLPVGLVFDHLDGTMARYRRTFTKLGSFYDKVSDLITWFVISAAFGWRAYGATDEAYYIVLALASAYALGAMGYMKWLVSAESERLRWLEARADPAAAIARRTAAIQIAPPPERTRADWIRWFLQMAPRSSSSRRPTSISGSPSASPSTARTFSSGCSFPARSPCSSPCWSSEPARWRRSIAACAISATESGQQFACDDVVALVIEEPTGVVGGQEVAVDRFTSRESSRVVDRDHELAALHPIQDLGDAHEEAV